MIRKCPICNQEMKSYDIDYNFNGNQDEYYSCENCHHSFIFYIRYHNVWKYDIWEQYFDTKDNRWYDKDDSLRTISIYKKGC